MVQNLILRKITISFDAKESAKYRETIWQNERNSFTKCSKRKFRWYTLLALGKLSWTWGDFGDLYTNCNVNLLLGCLKIACKFANFSDSSFQYIEQLVVCSMTHSYFKEPSGIFRTLMGFSMGDCSAARGMRNYPKNLWICHLEKTIFSKATQKCSSIP